MSIITYPLNGVTYDAEDVSTYLCTRTSGVYAKDSNYAVSVTGARQITVAPGLAWINYDDFKGVSACSREAVNLIVPDADGTLPRIDRVVLQFDTAANLTAVKLKPGTPAAAPEPPAILQNHNQYELGLCTVSVPAGSSVITAADITDTRADEDVCGVMRDGVTGIPTAQLQAQALAMMTQLSTELHTKLDALDAAIAAVESGSFYTKAEADAKFGTPYTLTKEAITQVLGFTPTKITAGTEDLIAGLSPLETGTVYLVYEEAIPDGPPSSPTHPTPSVPSTQDADGSDIQQPTLEEVSQQ